MTQHNIHHRYCTLALLLVTLIFTSCYQTSNIPEDEKLYAGIEELAYGHRANTQKKKKKKSSVGVITSFANAYSTVDGLISGNKETLKNFMQSDDIDQKQKDSILAKVASEQETYKKAKAEVTGVLECPPNGSIMGSSHYTHPFTIGLWIYNRYMYSDSRFGKWMVNTFGSTPKYISTVNPIVRTQVARNTLRNNGYFRGQVFYDLIPHKNPRKEKISYSVLPGELFHLDSIAYLNFPQQADSLIRLTNGKSLIHSGDPFSASNLSNERKRLTDIFRNNGYYYFRPEYISYRADTLQSPLKVQLQVLPAQNIPDYASRQFYIGKTRINVFKYNDYNIIDSIGRNNVRMFYSGGKKGKSPLRMGVIRRHLYLRKGDMFNQDVSEDMQNKLASIGIFSQMQVNYVPRDSAINGDTLDLEINAVLDKPYDSEFEGKVTTKSNDFIGPGLSYSINKRNAFRGAETLGFKVWGSYEWMTGAGSKSSGSAMNSWEYGANLNLIYPRFILFGLGKKLNRRSTASTIYRIEAKWINRSGYFGRVTVGTRMAWTLQRTDNFIHEITPLHLEYSRMMSTTPEFDRIARENPAFMVSMRDQFTPSMEYSFLWKSKKGVRNVSSVNLFVKEAGNITSCIYAIAGKPFSEKDKGIGNVPFAQFLKLTTEYTHKFCLTEKSSLNLRLFGGVIWSYGNSTTAPYSDLFTIGGANSIRAFGIRTMGPGSYHPGESAYSYVNQTGDLKFEANLEYRFPIISNLYGAAFIDMGNIWLIKDDPDRPGGKFNISNLGRELALGTGVGLRYDLDFLVIRFDLGIGIHSPYDTGKSGYYNMTSFGKSLGYHFAIGYPF